jgi:hypothetical protein
LGPIIKLSHLFFGPPHRPLPFTYLDYTLVCIIPYNHAAYPTHFIFLAFLMIVSVPEIVLWTGLVWLRIGTGGELL